MRILRNPESCHVIPGLIRGSLQHLLATLPRAHRLNTFFRMVVQIEKPAGIAPPAIHWRCKMQ